MPSKGTTVRTIRIAEELAADIEFEIAKRNSHSKRPPWDFSAYLRAGLREFKRKRVASRAPRGQRVREGNPEERTATIPSS